jgi:para-nitrobenzyl esterase
MKAKVKTSRCTWLGILGCTLAWINASGALVGQTLAATDPISTDSGKVAGIVLASGIHAFYGIPYAAPPVGELRWHAPMPAKPWTDVLNVGAARPGCAQRGGGNNTNPAQYSEDCLFVNVWTPPAGKPGAKLPVMVWIHGGGFQGGSPNIAGYSGEPMAAKGIVFVGVAYRLGVLGFMALPELTRESGHNASGNWAMMDQVAALKWVQRNIASFGGDPANVTIIGESAGSESVQLLQTVPMACGLFARISGWSGAILPPGNQYVPTLSQAEAEGLKLEKALHVNSLAEMRQLPWDKVVAATGNMASYIRRPDIDGYVVPRLPIDAYKTGTQCDVPLYVSSTANDKGGSQEFYYTKTLYDLQTLAKNAFADQADEFFKLFPASTGDEAIQQAQRVVGGNGFGIANRDWARAQGMNGKQPAYLAQFARVTPWPPDAVGVFATGAAHASDIVYWLGNQSTRANIQWTAWDHELSQKMMDTLIAFATTGNPNTAEVKIPRYDPGNEQRVVYGDKIWIEKLNTAQLEFLRAHPTSGSQQ